MGGRAHSFETPAALAHGARAVRTAAASNASTFRGAMTDRGSEIGAPSAHGKSPGALGSMYSNRTMAHEDGEGECSAHELEAAREALRQLKAKHAKELDAVKRQWGVR